MDPSPQTRLVPGSVVESALVRIGIASLFKCDLFHVSVEIVTVKYTLQLGIFSLISIYFGLYQLHLLFLFPAVLLCGRYKDAAADYGSRSSELDEPPVEQAFFILLFVFHFF